MSSISSATTSEAEKAGLELQRLRKEVEKLALEVESLRASTWWDRIVGRYLPIVTAILAVSGFWAGLVQFYYQQKDSATSRSEELHREAARPFWESQLSLYIKAADAAATIATSRDPKVRESAESAFWILYWGPLSCVEDITVDAQPKGKVEAAMVQFGRHLRVSPDDDKGLRNLALEIAHAMRDQIGPSFNLKPAPLAPSGTKN